MQRNFCYFVAIILEELFKIFSKLCYKNKSDQFNKKIDNKKNLYKLKFQLYFIFYISTRNI